MLYDRSSNERALDELFQGQADAQPAGPLGLPLTYLVYFCEQDVDFLRDSVQGSMDMFLSARWYDAEVIAEEVARLEGGASSLGDVLRKGLASAIAASSAGVAGAIVPIHGKDFFSCARQGVFNASLGESHFHILGRLRMHELAAANFVDAERFQTGRISDLTSDDFEWLFEEAFSTSQQRAVVTAYVDAVFGGHVPSTFDHWRREPGTYFSRYFKQLGAGVTINYDGGLERPERAETERRIVNWFSDKLKAQVRYWSDEGWPEIPDA